MILVLTSEHGGNEIPKEYKSLFKDNQAILHTHRGYDPGTLDLFKSLNETAYFSKSNTISRLLVECNRSLHHPKLFSEFTKSCDNNTKKALINNYYLPYRLGIENAIGAEIQKGIEVIHISLHSFTPKLNGEERRNDIGLLFDSTRKQEKEFCKLLKLQLKLQGANLKVRFNYPYLGKADGFTNYLRKKFQKNYIGIELEINQKLIQNGKFPKDLKLQVKQSLKKLILET